MCSLVKKDGSYVCTILFANLFEAKRAMSLTGSELGDRTFTVTLTTNGESFSLPRQSPAGPTTVELSRFADLLKTKPAHPVTTALVWNFTSATTPIDVHALCGGQDLVRDVLLLDRKSGVMALVDFVSADALALAAERLKVADPSAWYNTLSCNILSVVL